MGFFQDLSESLGLKKTKAVTVPTENIGTETTAQGKALQEKLPDATLYGAGGGVGQAILPGQRTANVTSVGTTVGTTGTDITASQVTKPTDVSTTAITAPTAITEPTITTPTDVSTTAITAPTVAAPTLITAPQAVTAGVGPAGIASQVTKIGEAAPQIGANLAGTAGQTTALGLATQAATGEAPSAAQLQQKQSFEEAIKAQSAQAAGSQAPGALRQAMQGTAALQAQAAQQSGLLKAQEMAAARDQLGNIASTISGQDISRQQANLNAVMTAKTSDLQAQVSTLSADQQAKIATNAQELQASGMNQETAYKTAVANQAALLQTEGMTVDAALKTALANQTASLQASGMNQETALKTALANQQAVLAATTSNQDVAFKIAVANQTAALQASGMNQETALKTALANQTASLQANQANQQAALQRDITQANLTSSEGIAKMDAYLKQTGLNDAMIISLRNEALQGKLAGADLIAKAEALKAGVQQSNAQQEMGASETQQKAIGGLIGAAGTVGAAVVKSDPKAKKNIKEGGGRDFLNALTSFNYEYKDKKNGEGTQQGIMAPDLAKVLPAAVQKGEDGIKKVDFGLALSHMLSGIVELNDDLSKLEASFAKRKQTKPSVETKNKEKK